MLMALYNDGAMKEVGYVEDENNYIYDIDPKVREDPNCSDRIQTVAAVRLKIKYENWQRAGNKLK